MTQQPKDANQTIESARGSIGKLYTVLTPEGDNDNDRLTWAILALAESQLAVARAIQETQYDNGFNRN
jgi:hypothetical protein